MTMTLFVDSLGKVLRFAEWRGTSVQPDTRGMTPSQVGSAVQSAALRFRSTTITVDYLNNRASAINRGGPRPEEAVTAATDVIATLDTLGRPVNRVAKVLGDLRCHEAAPASALTIS